MIELQQHQASVSTPFQFMDGVRAERTPNHLHLAFLRPYWVLSSAVENGGLVQASHLLNLRVDGNSVVDESPQQSLQKYAKERQWQGPLVAMMTAASMNSCRMLSVNYQGLELGVALTMGLSNAGRVGERADITEVMPAAHHMGTINIMLICSVAMTAAAMVEAVQMVTEAKVAALQDAGIRSRKSSQLATGTGTDAVAVCCGGLASAHGQEPAIAYCGKHLVTGELIGRLVHEGLKSSLAWYAE